MAKDAAVERDAPRRGRRKRVSERAAVGDFQNGNVEVKRVVKPVQNAVAILRYLTDTGEPSTVTQISRALELNASTCFNILRTLAGEQIIAFDPVRKTYQIGIGIMRIGAGAISEESRLTTVRPIIRDFAERFDVTMCVWRRLSPERNILIATEHSGGGLRIHMELGQRLPVLLGSTGRVMLQYLGLSKADLRSEFKKLRWFRAPSFEAYLEGAHEAKERGYGIDDGNFSPGVLAVSAPVLNPRGQILYSITIVTFRDQHASKGAAELGVNLVALAEELSPILY